MVIYSFSPWFISGEEKYVYMRNMSHTGGLWQYQQLNVHLLMLSFLNVTATQIYIQSPGIEEAFEDCNNYKGYVFPVSYVNLHFISAHCFQIEVSSFQQLLCRKITCIKSYSHTSYFSMLHES